MSVQTWGDDTHHSMRVGPVVRPTCVVAACALALLASFRLVNGFSVAAVAVGPTGEQGAAVHPVCGDAFTVLTVFRRNRANMCMIYAEISASLAVSLEALTGTPARQLCCGLGDATCQDGSPFNVTGTQVILLAALELVHDIAYVHGPTMLPARKAEVPAEVLTGWLPSSTSSCRVRAPLLLRVLRVSLPPCSRVPVGPHF